MKRGEERRREEEEEEEEEKEDEADKKKQSTATPAVSKTPNPILNAWYTDRDTFMVVVGGDDSGYLYECSFQMELPLSAVELHNSSALASMATTKDNSFWVVGASDGSVRAYSCQDANTNLLLPMHDNGQGVADVCISFDDTHLISAGLDGNLFVYHSALSGEKLEPQQGDEIPTIEYDKVDDILDPNTYSIEEAKQKAEQDKKMRTAADKKMDARRDIRKLRKEFEQLLAENEKLPAAQQLPRSAFELDPQIRVNIQAQVARKIEQVKAEMAWDLAKHTLAHHKLRNRFWDPVHQHRFVVKAFRSAHRLSVFRTPKLSSEFKLRSQNIFQPVSQLTALNQRVLKSSAHEMDNNLDTVPRSQELKDQAQESGPMATLHRQSSSLSMQSRLSASFAATNQGRKLEAAMIKADERKRKRAARQSQWAAHNANQPDEHSVNPADERAILEAEQNQGDYKLKTSDDYFVPESERVNASRKRDMLLQLRQHIFDAKTIFNQKVINMRERKRALVDTLSHKRQQLCEVLTMLGQPTSWVPEVPSLDEEEDPEKRLLYSRQSLEKFKSILAEEEERERAQAQKDGGDGGGFGGFGGMGGGSKAETNDSNGSGDSAKSKAKFFPVLTQVATQVLPADDEDNDQEETFGDEASTERLTQKHRLRHQRSTLIAQWDEAITAFDLVLKELCRRKTVIEGKVKLLDYHHVLSYQEYRHLMVFDERETALEARRNKKAQELADCKSAGRTAARKYAEKKDHIVQLQAQEKEVHAAFAAAIGEGNKFEKFLTKVFKKKIKRAKATQDNEESESESESDDEYLSSEEENSDSDDEEFDDSICPPGCSEQLYLKVLELRESKLDVDDAMTDAKKASELLRKEADSLVKREKQIKTALANAETDLTSFQLEKQAKLNQLDCVVPLRLSQIELMDENGRLPSDLSDALLFDQENIQKLKENISRLSKEKSLQRKEYKDIRLAQSRLQKEKKEKESEKQVLENKFTELQMLKFGMLIDITKLEQTSVNADAEELKMTQKTTGDGQRKELLQLDKKVRKLKEELMDHTRENTRRLADKTDLTHDKRHLDRALDKATKTLKADSAKQRGAELKELHKMRELISMQQSAIGELKEELARLSMKGGRVVPPGQGQQDRLPPVDSRFTT
eukprot:m.215633 g.215633  ORF g.215633 m.215633 type:complete len:1145 (+) comp26213_c1_seq1:4271-7705(+)